MVDLSPVFDGPLRAVARLRTSLNETEGLMRRVGALGFASSQKAFEEQALGDISWPPRYPGMRDPFINIAGALQDFNEGRRAPKPVRFQDRPALVDEGQRGGLWGSISFRTEGPKKAVWGSAKEYASLHQEQGSRSIQPVTETAKDGIRAWLYGRSQRMRLRDRSGRKVEGPQSIQKRQYASKLAPLLSRLFWVTKIAWRPFLGITDQLESDVVRATKDWFAERQRRGA